MNELVCNFFRPVVTLSNTRSDIQKFYILPMEFIYVIFVDLKNKLILLPCTESTASFL
jgi:hypothetical protein